MTGTSKDQTWRLGAGLFLLLAGSLITSMFFKEKWLWMDEVLSYVLITDSSLRHLNDAVVSNMDANPPVFANVYWFLSHYISANTLFLRAVSVLLFAGTVTFFFIYTTRLIGKPVTNFMLITLVISLTYLNFTLSTQIRGYALFLLITYTYFVCVHRLIPAPNNARLLFFHTLAGLLVAFTHNFGLFYLTAAGAFFGVLFLWSKDWRYGWVFGSYGVILLLWLVIWYANFTIQTRAGIPHSWIPMPTFLSFFQITGELAPTLSSKLEHQGLFSGLAILRFGLIVALFFYVAIPKVKVGFTEVVRDKAFSFYLLSGFIYLATIGIALTVSLVHTSVFISRYLWPSHLLVIYQLLYAFYQLVPGLSLSRLARLFPVYALLVGVFIFYQNRKTALFPSGILTYLPSINPHYPVFFEDADYFLPIWLEQKQYKSYYLLDWKTASRPDNALNATVEHKILESLHDKFQVKNVVTTAEFNKVNFPRFYVVDEASQYQIEAFIRAGRIKVLKSIPTGIAGHRILECTF